MRTWLVLLLTLPLAAQEPAAKPAGEAAKPAGATVEAAQAKPDDKAAKADAAPPAPDAEQGVTGQITLGYRWNGDVRGNENVYRSIVDLNSGIRLVDLDLSVTKANKLFDRLNLRVGDWGDPYNHAFLDVRSNKWYQFTGDYRNFLYFNNLPTFANPLLGNGSLSSQRSYDMQRRMSNFELDLLPSSRFIPYIAYSRSAGSGSAISEFVNGAQNQYPVRTILDDASDTFRGGFRLELHRMHASIEQGRINFGDRQRNYLNAFTTGDRTTPYLGQTLDLTGVQQSYGVSGHSNYTQMLFSAAPFSWADVRASVLHSRPETSVAYEASAGGVLVAPNGVDLASTVHEMGSGDSAMPHNSADVGFEVRPFSRMRILGSWMTDHYRVTSAALLVQSLLFGSTTASTVASTQTPASDVNQFHYNREQLDVLLDVTKKITLRAGQRFVWGDSFVRATITGFPLETSELRQSVGLAGISVRPSQKLSGNIDLEAASGSHSFFRTSLQDYHRVRARLRYQWTPSVQFGVVSSETHGENPVAGVGYDFAYYANAFNANWRPGSNKHFGITAEYMYSTMRSDLNYYLEPESLQRVRSFYSEHGHTASGLLDLTLPKIGSAPAGSLSVGGAMLTVGGTRPTDFFQPLGRLTVPVRKNVEGVAEWRWWGYNESIYSFEGFRDHQLLIGLRLRR
jgi:hypothetical protein